MVEEQYTYWNKLMLHQTYTINILNAYELRILSTHI